MCMTINSYVKAVPSKLNDRNSWDWGLLWHLGIDTLITVLIYSYYLFFSFHFISFHFFSDQCSCYIFFLLLLQLRVPFILAIQLIQGLFLNHPTLPSFFSFFYRFSHSQFPIQFLSNFNLWNFLLINSLLFI